MKIKNLIKQIPTIAGYNKLYSGNLSSRPFSTALKPQQLHEKISYNNSYSQQPVRYMSSSREEGGGSTGNTGNNSSAGENRGNNSGNQDWASYFSNNKAAMGIYGIVSAGIGATLGPAIGEWGKDLYISWRDSDKNKEIKKAELNQEIAQLVKDCSADMISGPKINMKFVNQMKQAVKQIMDRETDFFNNESLNPHELANNVYVIDSLANYYLYQEHGWKKARKLLEFAKDKMESYVKERSRSKFDFTKYSAQQKLLVLKDYKDMVEMYAKTIYLLGRTYIYNEFSSQKELDKALEYFTTTKYFGEEETMFEKVLADRSGIGIIRLNKAKLNIEEGNIEKAKAELEEVIELYRALKDDPNTYKLEYKPNSTKYSKIIPKNDGYNNSDCKERLVDCYSQLLLTTDARDFTAKSMYAKELSGLLLNETQDELEIIAAIRDRKLSNKKIASICNTLGYALSALEDARDLDCKKLFEQIKTGFKLSGRIDAEVTQNLFKAANQNSKGTDFTKRDALKGEMKAIERQLKSSEYSVDEKKQKQVELLEKRQELDEVNSFLQKKEEATLKGAPLTEEIDIGEINPFFGKYTKTAIKDILDLRIKALGLEDVETLSAYVLSTGNDIAELFAKINDFDGKTILVPLNLFDQHAVGLIIEKSANGSLDISYIDPENKPVSEKLKSLISQHADAGFDLKELKVEQQKYGNCGPEVIENFILHLTGQRLAQEEAVAEHSKLVEKSLLLLSYVEPSKEATYHTGEIVHENDWVNDQIEITGDGLEHQFDLAN